MFFFLFALAHVGQYHPFHTSFDAEYAPEVRTTNGGLYSNISPKILANNTWGIITNLTLWNPAKYVTDMS